MAAGLKGFQCHLCKKIMQDKYGRNVAHASEDFLKGAAAILEWRIDDAKDEATCLECRKIEAGVGKNDELRIDFAHTRDTSL